MKSPTAGRGVEERRWAWGSVFGGVRDRVKLGRRRQCRWAVRHCWSLEKVAGDAMKGATGDEAAWWRWGRRSERTKDYLGTIWIGHWLVRFIIKVEQLIRLKHQEVEGMQR